MFSKVEYTRIIIVRKDSIFVHIMRELVSYAGASALQSGINLVNSSVSDIIEDKVSKFNNPTRSNAAYICYIWSSKVLLKKGRARSALKFQQEAWNSKELGLFYLDCHMFWASIHVDHFLTVEAPDYSASARKKRHVACYHVIKCSEKPVDGWLWAVP